MNNTIPILILAFNRPDFLKNRIHDLTNQTIKTAKIIVAIDGPRISNNEDKVNILKIIDILESNLKLNISIIKRKENLGCTENTIL